MNSAQLIEKELKRNFNNAIFAECESQSFFTEMLSYEGTVLYCTRMLFPCGVWVELFFHYNSGSNYYGARFISSSGLNDYANSSLYLNDVITNVCHKNVLNAIKI